MHSTVWSKVTTLKVPSNNAYVQRLLLEAVAAAEGGSGGVAAYHRREAFLRAASSICRSPTALPSPALLLDAIKCRQRHAELQQVRGRKRHCSNADASLPVDSHHHNAVLNVPFVGMGAAHLLASLMESTGIVPQPQLPRVELKAIASSTATGATPHNRSGGYQPLASVDAREEGEQEHEGGCMLSLDEAFALTAAVEAVAASLDPSILVTLSGPFRRYAPFGRRYTVLFTTVGTSSGEHEHLYVHLAKFARHLQYARFAHPDVKFRTGPASMVLRVSQTPFPPRGAGAGSPAEADAAAGAGSGGRPMHLEWTTYDRYFGQLLRQTGPAPFVRKVEAQAAEKGYEFDQQGTLRDRRGATVALHSEVELFRVIGMPYVDPIDRS